jgi:hypothetical protein
MASSRIAHVGCEGCPRACRYQNHTDSGTLISRHTQARMNTPPRPSLTPIFARLLQQPWKLTRQWRAASPYTGAQHAHSPTRTHTHAQAHKRRSTYLASSHCGFRVPQAVNGQVSSDHALTSVPPRRCWRHFLACLASRCCRPLLKKRKTPPLRKVRCCRQHVMLEL